MSFHPVDIFGPASLSNLGPGFDALGLCISGIGDVVRARRTEYPGIRLKHEPGAVPWEALEDSAKNTAVIAAQGVLNLLGTDEGVELTLTKGIPLGSGIGGSAASAVAGAWAVNMLFGRPFEKEALIEAVLEAEDIASGGRHGDNALPALLGGLILVSSSDAARYRRIELPGPLHIALILPAVQVLTKQARDMLPDRVSLKDAAGNASELAFLVDAYRCGDWETVGQCMMRDRLVEPVRASLVPCYHAVRSAALEAGAFGCALTGSGPAMFALAPSADEAVSIRDAHAGGKCIRACRSRRSDSRSERYGRSRYGRAQRARTAARIASSWRFLTAARAVRQIRKAYRSGKRSCEVWRPTGACMCPKTRLAYLLHTYSREIPSPTWPAGCLQAGSATKFPLPIRNALSGMRSISRYLLCRSPRQGADHGAIPSCWNCFMAPRSPSRISGRGPWLAGWAIFWSGAAKRRRFLWLHRVIPAAPWPTGSPARSGSGSYSSIRRTK